ncbi:MAG TPA: hypothetical protein VFD46_07940 [Chryseolinea sp.]|nr:hypothetical protein [Chryseolinea sp.]
MNVFFSKKGFRAHGFLLAALFVSGSLCHGQISQPHRFEKEQKNSDDYYNIISLKENGLALYRERDKYKASNQIWELTLLDTTLQERAVVELEIKERHKLIGYEVALDYLYFLYRTGETTKNDFELIEVDLRGTGKETARYQIKPELDFKLTHFIKAGSNFVFGGYVSNEPAVVIYELPNKQLRVIPGFFQKDTELVDLRTNVNQTFNTVIIDRGSKDNRKLILRTFDDTGKQLLEDVVPIEEQKSLQTGITSSLQREDLAIIGTWGERNSKQSIGFYFLDINPFQEQKIKYVDFGQLTHYLDYLNPKRAERLKENSRDDATAGRIPNYMNYVMPFVVAEYPKGFLLLAEVYSPVSNVNPYYSSPYYYNPYYNPYGYSPYGFYYPGLSRMYRPYAFNNNNRNTNDVRTHETVLISFSSDGKINWDYSIKLDEIKIPGIEQVADFCLTGDQVYFLYKKESELKFKAIRIEDAGVVENSVKVQTSDPLDEIRSEKELEGGVRQWSSNTFYVWGYQTIRNTSKEDRIRDVFYINKVVVK